MQLLPLVNPEVGYSISHDFLNDAKTFKDTMTLINEENPTIAEFILKWCELGEPTYDPHCLYCGMIVYMMLRCQAEADDLEKTIKL